MKEEFEFLGLLFEWDPSKAEANRRKHGVSFAEAATVFADEAAKVFSDPDHSDVENRFLLVGVSYIQRILIVISVERADRIRIISARKATRSERKSL